MKRLNYLVILGILGMLILTMVDSIPASAGKDNHAKINFTDDGVDTTLCGVGIPYHLEMRGHISVFCNKNKEFCEGFFHWNGIYTLTSNDHTLDFHAAINSRETWLNYDDSFIEDRGSFWVATLPGEGNVWGTVGRNTYYEFCVGEDPNRVCEYEPVHWSGMVFDDPDAVCNYLLNGS